MYILYLGVKSARIAFYILDNLSEVNLHPIFLPHILTQGKKILSSPTPLSYRYKLSGCINYEQPLPQFDHRSCVRSYCSYDTI